MFLNAFIHGNLFFFGGGVLGISIGGKMELQKGVKPKKIKLPRNHIPVFYCKNICFLYAWTTSFFVHRIIICIFFCSN